MVDINMTTPEPIGLRPRGATVGLGGYIYKQGTVTSSDMSEGFMADNSNNTLVIATAGKTAVIDRLTASFGTALSLQLLANNDTLVCPIYGAANTTTTIEGPIRSDVISEGITFKTSGAGNITLFVIYHYE